MNGTNRSFAPRRALLHHHLRVVRPLLFGATLLGVLAYWPLAALTASANRSSGALSNLLAGYTDSDVRTLMVPSILVALWSLLALALAIRLFLTPTVGSPSGFLLERPVDRRLLWYSRLSAMILASLLVAAIHLVFWFTTIRVDAFHDGWQKLFFASLVAVPCCWLAGLFSATLCRERSRAALLAAFILTVGWVLLMIAVTSAPLAIIRSVHLAWLLLIPVAFVLYRSAYVAMDRREPLGEPQIAGMIRGPVIVTVLVALLFLPLAYGAIHYLPTQRFTDIKPASADKMLVEQVPESHRDGQRICFRESCVHSLALVNLASGRVERKHRGPLDRVRVQEGGEHYALWRTTNALGKKLPQIEVELFSVSAGRVSEVEIETGEHLGRIEFQELAGRTPQTFPWRFSIHDQLTDVPFPKGPDIGTSFALPSPDPKRLWLFDSNVDGLPDVDPFWSNDQELGGTGPFIKGPWRMWFVDLEAQTAVEIPGVLGGWDTLPAFGGGGWASERHLVARHESQLYLFDVNEPERGWYAVR
jgi:hypothetical protein